MSGLGCRPGQRQAGVALLTALLAAALTSTAVVEMTARQQIDIRRTENLLYRDQAWLYLLGAESWAQSVLTQDAAANKVDATGDLWATALPVMPVEGGTITGAIDDLQGRFNLNNLLREGQVSQPDFERFQRLLTALELETVLAQAVLDWLDPDLEARPPDGAEDGEYQLADVPYRTANAAMVNASELRLVKGFDAQTWRRLEPFVTALPEPTPINVNTASRTVLRCIAEVLTESGAEDLVDSRGNRGFASVEEFLQHPAMAGAGAQVAAEGLAVSSRYFRLQGAAKIGHVEARLGSLLRRERTVIIVSRTQESR